MNGSMRSIMYIYIKYLLISDKDNVICRVRRSIRQESQGVRVIASYVVPLVDGPVPVRSSVGNVCILQYIIYSNNSTSVNFD